MRSVITAETTRYGNVSEPEAFIKSRLHRSNITESDLSQVTVDKLTHCPTVLRSATSGHLIDSSSEAGWYGIRYPGVRARGTANIDGVLGVMFNDHNS